MGVVSCFVGFSAVVDFDLRLTPKDPGQYYLMNEGGRGYNNTYTVGFDVRVRAVNGTNVAVNYVAAFCCELAQNIGTGGNTFETASLSGLAASSAGSYGTASSGIPIGGIGAQRSAYVSYLFDRYYESADLSQWIYNVENPMTHAFQLALWEITHDSDLSLTNTTGVIYTDTQVGGDTILRNNAISIAQSMIDDICSANLNSSYVSTNFNIWALTSSDKQDIILAFKKGGQEDDIIRPMIPEPSTIAIAGFATVVVLALRRLIYWDS